MHEQEHPAPPAAAKKQTAASRAVLVAVIGLVLVALAGLGVKVGIMLASRTVPLIPANMQAAAQFPLYQPSPLPEGYTASAEEVTYAGEAGVLMLPITAASGHKLVLTQQALPKGMTYETLLGKGKPIEGAPGEAAISHVEGRNVASMIARGGKTLVIVNSMDGTPEELTRVLKSLKPVD
jgi:hypothetical protein